MSLLKSRFIEMFGNVATNNKRWEKTKLGNKSVIGSSKRIFANEYTTEGIPFYRSKEIIELGMGEKPSVELYISKKRYQEIKEKFGIPIPGDILMTAVGTIGKFWIVPNSKPFYYKDGNLVYIRTKEFNPLFLKKLLEMLIEKYKVENANGSAYTALTIEKLKDLQIVLPPMTLQKQYEEFHIQIDKSKFLLQQILEKLELLKKSRFIEMFIEKRYPTASLDELSICGGEYGAQSSAIEYHPNRPRYVRITDINEDGSLNNDYASSANIKDDEQYRLKYGDFLFARMGATVGKTYAYTFGDQIYAGYLIRYRLNLEKILPEYLFAFTRLNCYWKWVSINQNGAAQPGINAKKYGSLHVPVPPIEEQKKFIELSQQIDKSKLIIQKALEDLVGKV